MLRSSDRPKKATAGTTYWTHVAVRRGRTPKRIKGFPGAIAWLPPVFQREQVFITCGHGHIWWEGMETPCYDCYPAAQRRRDQRTRQFHHLPSVIRRRG